MNILRRLILAIYSLLLIALCGSLIGLTWADDQQFNWDVGGWNLQAFVDSSNSGKIIFTIILAAIALVGVLTLVLAVFRESVGARRGSLRLRQSDGGSIEVTSRAIETILREELQRLPDVKSVDARVRSVNGAVDTALDAAIAPTANIATVTTTLSQGVANVLREKVGVTNVRRPSIRISQDESAPWSSPAATQVAPHADNVARSAPAPAGADYSPGRSEDVAAPEPPVSGNPAPSASFDNPTLPPPPVAPSGSQWDARPMDSDATVVLREDLPASDVQPASDDAADQTPRHPAVADRWVGDHWESDHQ